jgi:hypothetical protein
MRESSQRRSVGESSLQRVETRNLQAADQISIGRHAAIVAVEPAETEGNRRDLSTETDRNSSSGRFLDLNAAVRLALARIGMLEKEAAAIMGISAGTFSKQLSGFDNCHVQLDKLALLPEAFHVEFSRIYAERVGLRVAHATVADLLVARAIELAGEAHALAVQLRGLTA